MDLLPLGGTHMRFKACTVLKPLLSPNLRNTTLLKIKTGITLSNS